MHEDMPGRRRRSRREQRRRRKAKRRRVTWAVTAAVLLLGGGGTYAETKAHQDDNGTPTAQRTPRSPQSSPTPTPVPMDLKPALDPLAATLSGNELSVALLDTESGKWATYGDGAFDTASIVKVDILATLLLQAQDAGRELTAKERAYAADMIENSDNDATSALWTAIGSAVGLDAANKRLGLSQTQGGGGTVWGVTRTTAQDQVRLLQNVFGEGPPLSAASRKYIQDLMRHIAKSQQWGVSAVADTGTTTALKNGWLQRSATKKWDVNSIGRVESGGRVYLMAVLLNGCTTEEAGIKIVEQAARVAMKGFASA
ncbi:serine hydrolase [Streptomyces sp. NBC_00370]|uniref:serine hydrolase n=1 Tax=Streptomyces sp. NBC_00370 TaxID=2975728 RepID=UPI002E27501B